LDYGGLFFICFSSFFLFCLVGNTQSEVPEAEKLPLVPPVGRSGSGLISQHSLEPDLLRSAYIQSTRALRPFPLPSSDPNTVFSGGDAHRSPARGLHALGVFHLFGCACVPRPYLLPVLVVAEYFWRSSAAVVIPSTNAPSPAVFSSDGWLFFFFWCFMVFCPSFGSFALFVSLTQVIAF
jgi:hypothetical protein